MDINKTNSDIGYHSPSAAKDFGETMWRTKNGNEVVVTEVVSPGYAASKRKDLACVGEVETFVRRISYGDMGVETVPIHPFIPRYGTAI